MPLTHATAVATRLIWALMLAASVWALVEAGAFWAVLFLTGAVAYAARRRWPGSLTTHGNAAFATAAAVRNVGLTRPNAGLHLGQLVDPNPPPPKLAAVVNLFTAPLARSVEAVENYRAAFGSPSPPPRLWSRQFAHASIFAASRSGKGAAVLVTTLLTYPGPVLVLDPKPELYTLTAAARRAMGRDVRLIDPYREIDPSGGDRFNPLSWIDPENELAPDLARDLAVALVPRTGQEKETFFPNMSEIVIQLFILGAVWAADAADRDLATVADLIANPDTFAKTLKAMQQSSAYGGVLRTLAYQISQLEGREKASILASVAQYFGFLNSVPVREAIRDTTFDPLWLKTGCSDLFIAIPPEKLRSASGFVRYLLSGLLRRLSEGPPDESRPVLVVLDECAALGNLPILEDAVTLLAGWGLKFVFVWQSLGQVSESFPNGKAQTFMANMSLQVFGKTNDLETAKHVSERCGDATVLATSVQDGGSHSRTTGAERQQESAQRSTSWSVTRNETGRRLIRTEEVLNLPAENMIVFTDRTAPILVRQVRYYAPEFARGGQPSTLKTFGRVAAACVVWLTIAVACAIWARAPVPTPGPLPGPTQITPDRDRGRSGGRLPHRPPRGFNDGR